MASKRITESKKDKSNHKTAKTKSAGEKDKNKNQTVKTRKAKNETTTVSKSIQKSKNLATNRATRHSSETEKQSNEKTLIIDDDDLEGMTVPPKEEDAPSSPKPQGPRPGARVGRGPPQPPPASARAPARRPARAKSPVPSKIDDSEDDGDGHGDGDDEDTPVKQFSFPAYKILSGASVAPVQMHPQKVVIHQTVESNKRHWGAALTGLFQNSKLTLKLRMLRLLLIWIFFRVLNKQTAWISDMLGIGIPEPEPPGPKVRPPPGERFVRVFREGDPNPFHVKVKKPL